MHAVSRAFGGIRAVDGVSLALQGPAIVGLIGPNGAGKTTLFDLIAGRQRADAGEIRFDGTRIDRLPEHRRARLGLSRTFQECRVLPEETCLDNILFAAQPKTLSPTRLRRFRGRRDRAEGLLELVRLQDFANRAAGDLSYGQRRLLEVACALASDPTLLLLDEPASGVNPAVLDLLHDVLLRVARERRMLLVIVEHNMPFIMSLASHIVVMQAGRVLTQGEPATVRDDPRVIEAYLG
jgi:ABC-type branched-subunit amino acid transport system ATPase component